MTTSENIPSARVRDVRVCLQTFDLSTIKETCYRFAAKGYRTLQVEEDGRHAVVSFGFGVDVPVELEDACIDQFKQALLDQDLRRIVRERTKVARELILANAFADTVLVDNSDG